MTGTTFADVGAGTYITDTTGKPWRATHVRYDVATAAVTASIVDAHDAHREITRPATHPAAIAWHPPHPDAMSVVAGILGGTPIDDDMEER